MSRRLGWCARSWPKRSQRRLRRRNLGGEVSEGGVGPPPKVLGSACTTVVSAL